MGKIFAADKEVKLSISEEDKKLMDERQKVADEWTKSFSEFLQNLEPPIGDTIESVTYYGSPNIWKNISEK